MPPTPHHSIFTGQMLFLTPNQQCQSTEAIKLRDQTNNISEEHFESKQLQNPDRKKHSSMTASASAVLQ